MLGAVGVTAGRETEPLPFTQSEYEHITELLREIVDRISETYDPSTQVQAPSLEDELAEVDRAASDSSVEIGVRTAIWAAKSVAWNLYHAYGSVEESRARSKEIVEELIAGVEPRPVSQKLERP